MGRILLIEDDEIMAECMMRSLVNGVRREKINVEIARDAIDAMNALSDELPDLIFLDILLNGPDGFSFLNELVSYSDTVRIPIAIVSSLDLSKSNLNHYGVRKVLQKEVMLPRDLVQIAEEILFYEK